MTEAALAGLRVINTRPQEQAATLSQLLREQGAQVEELPLIAIHPLPLSEAGRYQLMELDRYDYVFCVSRHAARLGLAAAADYWPQWPHQLPVLAVGQATADDLHEAGLRVLVPEQEDSEGVLALAELAQPAGLSILVWRGEGGRELFADSLRAAGARVDVLELYRRELPARSALQLAALGELAADDVVLLSSPAAWAHWQQLAGELALRPWLLCVSPRLAEVLRAAGGRVITAPGPRPEQLLAGLQRWREQGQHDID